MRSDRGVVSSRRAVGVRQRRMRGTSNPVNKKNRKRSPFNVGDRQNRLKYLDMRRALIDDDDTLHEKMSERRKSAHVIRDDRFESSPITLAYYTNSRLIIPIPIRSQV